MTEKIKTSANITCSKCDHIQKVQMPENACQHFFKCVGCGEMLKPIDGDCCVFCSYSDTFCPPKQVGLMRKHANTPTRLWE